ncbi:CapA family protein [Kribbella sp. VKM Ac-2566]|uniref:CapA family protein n=1 Tax=Kribbella sp. VKM Ac-2566 TaxID=2512218 RepID=UPI0010642EFB|nr:CapA family protein [Kribbella sp. VKM Ac-2566]TDX02933.1 poly-gamma-glutamate synthesis protein (capsule biosynthesis protein) [Kribbella sp. VKM Ac-2566]
MADDVLTVFLGGDVMLGRGVDQILPHPGDPALWEAWVRDARTYVQLAEAMNGPIPAPVAFDWPWGDALALFDRFAPDVRLVNLETSVTARGHAVPGKAVHYRMNPANHPALIAGEPDVCSLANNHILDFGVEGLSETLEVLGRVGVRAVGAGRTTTEAVRPAVVPTTHGRVLVFAFGTTTSGVPIDWAATDSRPGIALLPDLSRDTVSAVVDRIQALKRPGDIVVLSVHWGSNWGYDVPSSQRRFAHRVIDGGVDLVHGHSSHHLRPIEVYRDRLVLYGCGGLIDDYEGIAGYEHYRDDLRLLYFAGLEPTGRLADLRMGVMQAHRIRLRPAGPRDREWSCRTLDEVSRGYGTRVRVDDDGLLRLT